MADFYNKNNDNYNELDLKSKFYGYSALTNINSNCADGHMRTIKWVPRQLPDLLTVPPNILNQTLYWQFLNPVGGFRGLNSAENSEELVHKNVTFWKSEIKPPLIKVKFG